ncbi:amidohydrolase family protein [Flavobacterium sp. 140616W15]|uniref:amidohydrolase family protein n=1 Tax=Flavobacterium sp. 140616W15 TaxID=2478552 RepID=UPI000F0C2BA4|nr:amidohydrolase family protein [Flavobacterium sp. 140616W15]AYN03558.1 hypothetical protein EAG11_04775 [Flavobacterium sp. 140616W15]
MTVNEFITTARQVISDDPKTRLSAKAKQAITDKECIIDIHTHIFDRRCLSTGYVLLRMLKSKLKDLLGLESFEVDSLLIKTEEEIYEEIKANDLNSEADWEKLESDLETVAELTSEIEFLGLDIREALRVLKKGSMREVLDHYVDNFSVVQLPSYKNRPFLTGVLMMDLATGWDMKPRKCLSAQIDEIKAIMADRPILPFLAIDPRRVSLNDKEENIYDLFIKAFNDRQAPFFGVKCYPSMGYLPTDVRLDPIFKICAEKNIPVVSHCGGESVSTFEKSIVVEDQTGVHNFVIPGNSRPERARYLNNPEAWIPVLEKYPKLKLNLAHFGGDDFWLNHSKTNLGDVRVKKIIAMLKNPNWNVYTDFSFNLVESELFETFKKELDANAEIQSKVMFGTDYWVVLPAGDLLNTQGEFLDQLTDYSDRMISTAPLDFILKI